MKHYRNLNGCVSRMHRLIYEAYDKGYVQGRKDFERPHGSWISVPQKKYISYRCSICKSLVIAKYMYCPHCGSKMGEEDGET